MLVRKRTTYLYDLVVSYFESSFVHTYVNACRTRVRKHIALNNGMCRMCGRVLMFTIVISATRRTFLMCVRGIMNDPLCTSLTDEQKPDYPSCVSCFKPSSRCYKILAPTAPRLEQYVTSKCTHVPPTLTGYVYVSSARIPLSLLLSPSILCRLLLASMPSLHYCKSALIIRCVGMRSHLQPHVLA